MTSKRSFLKPAWPELLLLVLCAAFCSIQLFIPPYIGLANNGDFAKVFARFSCSPPDRADRNFRYFVANYEFDPKYYWTSEVLSSEILLAAPPILLVKASGAHVFNIRWLGALHLSIYLCGYYALLLYLRRFGRAVQLVAGAFAIWVFTDVAYAAYCNSFFSDTAAFLGMAVMVPLALHLASQQPPRAAAVWLYTVAALLFIGSKSQHGVWGIFPAAFLVWRRRFIPAALLVAAEIFVVFSTPALYTAQPLFTVIFDKLLPQSADPMAALRQLGLREPEIRYVGMNAYSPGAPVGTGRALIDFGNRTSYGKVLRYWLRHPRETVRVLYSDLVHKAHDLRPPNLSNFRREDGHPPFALTHRFASWSDLRSRLLRRWPLHIAVWYGATMTFALGLVLFRRPFPKPAIIFMGICAMALLEFAFASLADAIETERHLFLFHFMTEITICFVVVWALDGIARKFPRSRRTRQELLAPCGPAAA